MDFEISGERVSLIRFSFQVDVITDDETFVQIEAPFRIEPAGVLATPGEQVSTWAPHVLEALFTEIVSVIVESQMLTITFSNGIRFEVTQTPGFESWNVNRPKRSPSLVVMDPDGRLVTFD